MNASSGRIAVPLLVTPSYDPKTWGGRRLEQLGKVLPGGAIGESLESGPAAVVNGGPFDGVTLGELSRTHAAALLGSRGQADSGAFADFPLLVKLIDAHHDLSVQVHPDDARAPTGKRGKTEAWYILDAEPGARIITGVSGPIQIERIGEQLVESVVRPGEVYFVPAGTVHAIGAGVLLYEIQQASDVTWRLFDWGRPREIHVEAALAAADPARQAVRIESCRITEWCEVLVACPYFALERWMVDKSASLPAFPSAFRVVTVLEGELVAGDVRVPHGATVVLPADLPESELTGRGIALVGYIPDLDVDVRAPLLAAGHDVQAIERLGLRS
ncbi:MAG TPA: type I phosphomannose isomerase catalytic subunit [Thermomicrobiales bacterium]|nr:type I phosphomannose isomerase catalytic subunit [Thermomicrobiales bacterium]